MTAQTLRRISVAGVALILASMVLALAAAGGILYRWPGPWQFLAGEAIRGLFGGSAVLVVTGLATERVEPMRNVADDYDLTERQASMTGPTS